MRGTRPAPSVTAVILAALGVAACAKSSGKGSAPDPKLRPPSETGSSSVPPADGGSGAASGSASGETDTPAVPSASYQTLGSADAVATKLEGPKDPSHPIAPRLETLTIAELRQRFIEGKKRPAPVVQPFGIKGTLAVPCVRKSALRGNTDPDLEFELVLSLNADSLGITYTNAGTGRSRRFNAAGQDGELIGYPDHPIGGALDQLEVVRGDAMSLVFEHIVTPATAALSAADAALWQAATERYQVSAYDTKALAVSYAFCELTRGRVDFSNGLRLQLQDVPTDAARGQLIDAADLGIQGRYDGGTSFTAGWDGTARSGVPTGPVTVQNLTFAAGALLTWHSGTRVAVGTLAANGIVALGPNELYPLKIKTPTIPASANAGDQIALSADGADAVLTATDGSVNPTQEFAYELPAVAAPGAPCNGAAAKLVGVIHPGNLIKVRSGHVEQVMGPTITGALGAETPHEFRWIQPREAGTAEMTDRDQKSYKICPEDL